MKRTLSGLACLATLLTVTACSGGPEGDIAGACSAVLTGDPMEESVKMMSGAEVPELCKCYATQTMATNKPNREMTLAVLQAIQTGKVANDKPVESVVRGMEKMIEANAEAYPFTVEQIDEVGEAMEDAAEAVRLGTCG